MKPSVLSVLSISLALLVPALAGANLVTFDFEPLGTTYGAPAGASPGDLVFMRKVHDKRIFAQRREAQRDPPKRAKAT